MRFGRHFREVSEISVRTYPDSDQVQKQNQARIEADQMPLELGPTDPEDETYEDFIARSKTYRL